jgi:isoleucyl-tRNA synthetase
MSQTPDYKATVRLPQTDFPMKANLAQKEPEMIKKWQSDGIYQKLQEKNKDRKSFVLPDGPPYANGSIHVGHALNKILKDIIIKYKNMRGFQAPFIPGWDCHGLPIEHAVMKNLGSKAREKTDSELRSLCRAEARKWIEHQRPQFQRLGVLADWENPYITMDPVYEAEQVREFARAYQKGVVYLGVKPVYWNWTLQTALADAEVEYHPHKSPAIYVKFPIEDAGTLKKLKSPNKKVSAVIWTTTPWTLPANLGISLNANFEYGLFEHQGELLLLAKSLKEFVEKDIGVTLVDTEFSFKGKDLDRGLARHPFYDRDALIMLGDHVTQDAGTGAVHTAPGHGMEDYKVGLQYGLDILSPVDNRGAYTDEVPEYQGTQIFKANPLIIERLQGLGRLLAHKEIEHSYPHCWRSKTPLFFRATAQWFIGLDLEKTQLRKIALAEVDKIKFFPAWGEARFRSMMESRPDWCLSRQRIWGVPIPIFYCLKTEKPLVDQDVMMKVADTMEKEGGIEAFFKYSPEFFIGDTVQKKSLNSSDADFGSQGFRHGKDIFDVWYDSGVCHAAVQKRRTGMTFPADIYLEGSDQHRGWFNTSLLSSVATNGQAPFKALITHGFVMDSQGLKMSKSKGNVVDPNEVAKQSGTEILRLWTSYEDYGTDVKCGQAELERVTETYRRIRNTMRFLLGANADFNAATDMVPLEKMTPIDRWALARLYDLNHKVTEAYDSYSFNKVYHALNLFFTVDLSATYLDVLKDRLYTWKVNGPARRSAQTVIHHMTSYLIGMMAPILSFLAEESYTYLAGNKKASVFLTDFPVAPESWKNADLSATFEELLKVRSDVQKKLEELRAQKVIGASLEAKVTVSAQNESLKALQYLNGKGGLSADLREFFIVSEVSLVDGPASVKAEKAGGEKCVRCWVYVDDINTSTQFPSVCSKCVEALS